MTEVLQTPIKSPNDKNLYRLIKLENGLKALLIQHESADQKAAMAICVDVGGFDDPQNAKGLSHFLEHMLFMGSEKYPKENEIDEFIKGSGGNSNAYTSYKETVFHFEIKEDALEGAVDRFSSTFIAPLMAEDSVEREVQAVESEFRNKFNDNVSKFWQLFYKNCNEGFKAFVVGNFKTLKESRSNTELYQLVHEHRRKFYVANRMTLAIESSKSLNDLQKIIENSFIGIEVGEARAEIPQDEYKKIFKPQSFDKLTYMKPKNEYKSFYLHWPLPYSPTNYKSAPLDYLKYLLRNSFEGGLETFLKNKSFITSFFGETNSTAFGQVPLISDFFLGAFLTKHGSKNIQEVLNAIFSYFTLIKETPMEKHRELFEDWQKIRKIDFEFMESDEPLTNVKMGILKLKLFEDIDVLRSEYYPLEYDEEIIKKYIDLLNEPNFYLSIIDHELEVEYDQVEEFYGTDYKEVEISEEHRRLWNERVLIDELSLPPKNDFISTNFDVYANNLDFEKMDHPVKIFENDVAEAFYKMDSEFKTPKVYIMIKMDSPVPYESPKNFVLTEIFVDVASDKLKMKYASALQAKLNLRLFMQENSIRLQFSGYNDKMEKFIQLAMEDIKNIQQFCTQEAFEVFKERSIKNRKKLLLESNFQSSMVDSIFTKNSSNTYDCYQAVKEIKFEDLENFGRKLFEKLRIQILIQGNFLKDQALNVTKMILDNIGAEAADRSLIDPSYHQIPEGKTSIKLKSFSKNEINSTAEKIFDLGARSARYDVLGYLLYKIISEPFFDTLRTKEQLGYTIYANLGRRIDAFYLKLFIKFQEKKFSSQFIAQRLKKFVDEDLKEIFENLTDEKFTKIRGGAIFDLLAPFSTLSSEVAFNMRRIAEESYIFDLNQKQAEIYRAITKQEIVEYYKKIFEENKHRSLIFQVVGNAETDSEEENELVTMRFINEKYNEYEEIITDIEGFKNSLQSHPKYRRKDLT